MTPEEKNAAIAKAVGTDRFWLLKKHGLWWRPDSAGYTGNIDEAGRYTYDEAKRRECKHGHSDDVTMHPAPIPNYVEDLNAIHSAIMSLPASKHREFSLHLHDLVCGQAEPDPHEDDFYVNNATALQRSDTLIATLNLIP